jgi:hypothetical protein
LGDNSKELREEMMEFSGAKKRRHGHQHNTSKQINIFLPALGMTQKIEDDATPCWE